MTGLVRMQTRRLPSRGNRIGSNRGGSLLSSVRKSVRPGGRPSVRLSGRPSVRAVCRGQGGFTLMEVLIALLIISIVMTAGSTMMIASMRASDQLRQLDERLGGLQQTQAILRRDLAQMVARPARDEYGQDLGFAFRGTDDPRLPLLSFTRAGWDNPDAVEARSDLQYVEYVFADGVLSRRYPLRPDPTPDTPVVTRVLLTGVRDLRISFGDAQRWSNEWLWASSGASSGASRGTSQTLGMEMQRTPPAMVWLELDIEGLGEISLLVMSGFGAAGEGGA